MKVITCFFCGVLFLYTSFGKLIERHENIFCLLELLRDIQLVGENLIRKQDVYTQSSLTRDLLIPKRVKGTL